MSLEHQKRVQILLIVSSLLLTLGIFFRFDGLGLKFPWIDECITQVRISDYGYSAEAWRSTLDSKIIDVGELKNYLAAKPSKSPSWLLTHKLAPRPEHPPLYYTMARLVAGRFGNTIELARGLSAYISLLAFPGIFWLGCELFGSPIFGLTGIGVIAISPIYVLYAQEAREYSLWIVVALFSSAALLRALDKKSRRSWFIYSLTLGIGLYSHLFFLLNVVAQAVYVSLLRINDSNRRLFRNYLISLIIGVTAFLPWLSLFFLRASNVNKQARWFSQKLDILTISKRILGNILRTFFDLGFDETTTLKESPIILLSIISVLLFIGYCIAHTAKSSNKSIAFYIFSLILPPLAIIFVAELLSGKVLSQTRYLMPVYLGIQLAVIHFIGDRMMRISGVSLRRSIWPIAIGALITGSILSCSVSSRAEFWWNKGSTKELSQMAQIINTSNDPLLISDSFLPRLMTLGYQLHSTTPLKWSPWDKVADIPETFQEIYFLGELNIHAADLDDLKDISMSLSAEIPNVNLRLYKGIRIKAKNDSLR